MTAARNWTEPPRIVIVGAGFGGYFAARKLAAKLKPSRAHITIISDSDGLLYQPLLPEVAVGALDARAIAVPLSTLKHVHLVRGAATGVDLDQQRVEVVTGTGTMHVPYDRLLLNPGGVTRTFDIPGLREYAVGFKTVAEALYLRDLLLRRMEQANDRRDPDERRKLLTFIVVGAGYAGTELVAQMTRMSEQLLRVFPGLSRDDLNWLLLDTAKVVMPELGPELGLDALKVLRARQIDVRLGTSVKQIDDTGVTLTDGTRLDGACVIWCAGVAPNPLMAATGLQTTKGRLNVDAQLQVPGHAEIYGIGDAAAVPNLKAKKQADGSYQICPPTAQHAMRQGKAAARNLVADIRGRSLRPYKHRDLGLVVDLGGWRAVAKPVGIALHGVLAKLVTRGYHLMALPTMRRRMQTATGWLLAGRTPDDVSFGVSYGPQLLASEEHRPQVTVRKDKAVEQQPSAPHQS